MGMVGRIITSKDVHDLNSETCENITLYVKKDFTSKIKFIDLK